jgi:hypothetical protein
MTYCYLSLYWYICDLWLGYRFGVNLHWSDSEQNLNNPKSINDKFWVLYYQLAVEYEDSAIFVKVNTDDEYEFARDMQVCLFMFFLYVL